MLLLNYLFKLNFDVPTPWGIYFQDSATPVEWKGNSLIMRDKLLNSGDALELLVPSYIRKGISGWSNDSCKVTSHKVPKGKKVITDLNQ